MNRTIQGQQIEIRDITDQAVQFKPAKSHKPESKNKIYIRAVKGPIESLRRISGLFFLALFLLLPWLTYNGQQAVLLDFTQQRFHLFGITLWPQDLTILAWIFIVAAFALFFVTALWGRVWCGFMCPQTVFTFLYVWVEEKVEGSRNKRIQLDKQAWSLNKFFKKSLKHGLWLLIASITAFTFVGYFTPIKSLALQFLTFEMLFWPTFYVAFFALCTYGNAGWMREIMCTHICPYSRFQSAMFDDNTTTVTYDSFRGEGRGPRPKKLTQQQYKSKGLGDCIDCNLCVQVCPAGIDIREGLQYECINCGACVDACNGVMANMGYKKDLISFTSANALKQKAAPLLRPKVIGYFLVLVSMVALLSLDLVTRPLLDLNILRDRTVLYRDNYEGNVENVYTLAIMNKAQQPQEVRVAVQGLEASRIHGATTFTLAPGELIRHPITIEMSRDHLTKPVTEFSIAISSGKEQVNSNTTFFSGT